MPRTPKFKLDGFCTLACKQGYQCDMQHGALYGPYKLDGRFVSGKEFHAACGTCRYCNARIETA